jgi:hypothetical protein
MNKVYIIFAADADCTSNEFDLDAYAAANSYELAEKIAQKDEADGQILSGWTIQEMFLNTSEADL